MKKIKEILFRLTVIPLIFLFGVYVVWCIPCWILGYEAKDWEFLNEWAYRLGL